MKILVLYLFTLIRIHNPYTIHIFLLTAFLIFLPSTNTLQSFPNNNQPLYNPYTTTANSLFRLIAYRFTITRVT
ncbi:hypothetical protein RhiirA1_86219 [Rhizophagus irregularis]|uniref:Uncharacterized protein n=1 Tax=Rhizophagus irregularis TaxID=588596 RepID=A0A2N0R172_9GLOM|nr:hypothetical protein RhiirA1_86219 [Rhizophagus irregularis]